MSIRKKIRQSYRYDFGIGDLFMIVKKPTYKSKRAKRRSVLNRNWIKRNIEKLTEIIDDDRIELFPRFLMIQNLNKLFYKGNSKMNKVNSLAAYVTLNNKHNESVRELSIFFRFNYLTKRITG